MKLLLAALALSTVSRAADIPEKGVEFSASGHTLVLSRGDEFDPTLPFTGVLLHETRLGTQWKTYRLGVQFTDQLPLTPGQDLKHFTLDKKYLSFELKEWRLTAGDSHIEVGKGIALSLYEHPTYGVNTTLEGGYIRHKSDANEVALYGGRINTLTAAVAINPLPNLTLDKEVWLTGAQGKGKISSDFSLGAHYFRAGERPKGEPVFEKLWHSGGLSLSRTNEEDGVEGYLETNILLTELHSGDNVPNAIASYGSVTFVPAPWKVKIEAKDYRNYIFDFRLPPSLEEDFVDSLNIEDVSALKVASEYRVADTSTRIKASYLVGQDRQREAAILHGVTGVSFKWLGKTSWEFNGGYRVLPADSDLTHIGGKIKVSTTGAQTLEFSARRLHSRNDLSYEITLKDRNQFELTYSFSPKISLTSALEWIPTNTVDEGQYFANVGASVRLGAFTVRTFIGRTSGGMQCAGGVCRQVPPFNGGLLESTYVF